MRRYSEQPHIFSSMGSGLRKQIGKLDKIPPDDIGNRAIEPTAKIRVADNLGNAINQAPTHLESGVLQFLQFEWSRNFPSRNKVVAVRHLQTRTSSTVCSPGNSFHLRQPARAINRRRQIETKSINKLQVSVTENSANTIRPSQPLPQRKKVVESEQLEQKKIRAAKMIQETIRLCGCEAHVEAETALDKQGHGRILVFVEEITKDQPNDEKTFAQGKPALAALATIAGAGANPHRNEPITFLTVLPMQDKNQYQHNETLKHQQKKAASL